MSPAVAWAQAAMTVPSGAIATEPVELMSTTSAPRPTGLSHVGAAAAGGAASDAGRARARRRTRIVSRR